MTQNEYTAVSVSSTLMTTGTLAIGSGGVTALAVLLGFALPLSFVIPGVVYLYKRKKR